MQMTHLNQTRHFREVNASLLTAGQPSEAQLADAASQGVEVVINLALHDDPRYSLADEPGCVRAAGMTYVHIPVQFDNPTKRDLMAFFDAMEVHRNKKVLVHCAANMRVTAFLGLWAIIREGQQEDQAFAVMRSVWEPNELWKTFIESMLNEYKNSSTR